ncbi:hypothetical protein BDB00DRAFT_808771 [Zychaea mexicana]|uniref:uncharacterized protein n=1 Tax=Zychaea mexicana TaxID=64656 RepID=UPI0022FE6B83|nr:uncharacterized protein BDB00DRAFT_808771 [Zychaea mexicana]KAI9496411.1 hypothetical protein BDB00DRAFT_808771 [Zychaea mexicana]
MADAPFEILELIASYSTTPAVATSCLVCQSWLNPMRKHLYRTIHIDSRKRFRRFFRSIQQLDIEGIPYGQHVKSLVLRDNVGMTWVELEQLAVLCPALEVLYFHQRIWNYVPRRQQISQSWQRGNLKRLPPMNYHAALRLLPTYGSRLTTLHIVLSQPAFSLFANTPHLKELVLLPNDEYHHQGNHVNIDGGDGVMNSLLPIHANHFRSIMDHCPHLTVLKVLCKVVMRFELAEEPTVAAVIDQFPIESSSPSSYTTHDQLQTLEIGFAKSSISSQYACIRYITQAFPNMVTLDINFITINTFALRQPFRRAVATTPEEQIQTFIALGQQCRKLETLRLRGVDALLAPNRTFFETLETAGTQLKALEMGRVQELLLPGGSAHYLRYNKETYDAMLQAVGSSLTMLHLHTAYWSLPHVSRLVATITQSCPSLNDLKISALAFGRRLRSPIDIGILLNKLLNLERLEINNAHVVCSDSGHVDNSNMGVNATTSTPASQKVTTGTINRGGVLCKLKSFLLNRVHFAPELFTVLEKRCPRLSQLSVICSVQQQLGASTAFTLRMPDHVFDKINVTEIYLELEASRVGYTVVCSLKQVGKPTWAKRDSHHHGKVQATRWYVNHRRRLRDKHIKKIKQFEKFKEAIAAAEACEDKETLKKTSVDLKILDSSGNWKDWMKHGRVAIECKSVSNFIFNGGSIIP